MSTPRMPNRPTQQQIFRRRRAFALVVLILLVWALVAAISSFFNSIGAKAPTQSSSPVVTAAPGQACVPGSVLVTAFIGDGTKSQASFDTDVKPLIWFSLTNTGKVDCTFSAGSRVQFFTITSGPETIWSSKDCDRSKDVDYTATLKPNVPQTSPAQTWSRVHSAGNGPGSGCGVGQAAVTAGGASYHLKAEVGGVISSNDVQFVLN
jgi:hypothetical protein